MQHAREQLPSSQHPPAPSQQLESQSHLSPPPHYPPPHYIPPSQHHSQISSFQTTFPVAPSPHVINDPTSHSSSRRSIPSLLQNQQYQHPHQHPLSTDLIHPESRNPYPPYASQTAHPYFHQSRFPANDISFHPNGPHMLYMQTPPPAQPPYYPYHTPPSIHLQPNPDHLYQHLHPTNAMPRGPGQNLGYQKDHIVHQTYPPDPAMRTPSSSRGHTFENENVPDPNRSLPTNISTAGNTSKDHNNFKPLASLPPLPSHATSHSFYPSPQGMQNMTLMMPPPRSVLSAVPYHPSTHMSPSVPVQNMQQVPETGHFYNNPYHHNTQSGFPPEQNSQQTPVNNLQWQTHLAPAAHAHSTKDGGDDAIGFSPYYVGPDRVTRYYGQQSAPRKKRLQWIPQLHAKFVKAVEEFGVEKAVPKLLLQAMNVPGLTRENVASHLQKYRESMRKRKLETERSHRGMKSESKEFEEVKTAPNVESKDDIVGAEKLEVRTDEDERPLEGFIKRECGDSSKRLRDIETGTSETVDSKRQKAASGIHENEVLKGTELRKQEVESYARVRARVDEALQLQTPRGREGQREPDVS